MEGGGAVVVVDSVAVVIDLVVVDCVVIVAVVIDGVVVDCVVIVGNGNIEGMTCYAGLLLALGPVLCQGIYNVVIIE